MILFVDLSKTYVQYTPEKFLREVTDAAKNEVPDVEMNISEFYDFEIACETYRCVDFTMENGYTLTYSARIYDDRIITIWSSTSSKAGVVGVFNSIEEIEVE